MWDLPGPGIKSMSARGKATDKKWFTTIGRLWGLQTGGWEEEFPCPYMSSQDCHRAKEMSEKAVAHDRNGKSSQVLVYHLSLIFLFLVCAEESLLYWAHGAGCGSHATIDCFRACLTLMVQSFVAERACFLQRSVTYRGLPYFFLYLQSSNRINCLTTLSLYSVPFMLGSIKGLIMLKAYFSEGVCVTLNVNIWKSKESVQFLSRKVLHFAFWRFQPGCFILSWPVRGVP